jgi:hypothetical protein
MGRYSTQLRGSQWKWCNLTLTNSRSLTLPTSTRKWVFLCLAQPLPVSSAKFFSYSVSGFIAEPSQSAQRPHKILRPSNPADMVCREGRRCVFFFATERAARRWRQPRAPRGVRRAGASEAGSAPNKSQDRLTGGPTPTYGAPLGVKRRCRPCVSFL